MTSIYNSPYILAGIESPRMIQANESSQGDDEKVVGVEFDGKFRGYPLRSMIYMVDYVVNDVIECDVGKEKVFTSPYCDRTNRIQVQQSNQPVAGSLQISTLGLQRGDLSLSRNDRQFEQMETIGGLHDMEHSRLTWREWETRHPSTLVYMGPAVIESEAQDTLKPPVTNFCVR